MSLCTVFFIILFQYGMSYSTNHPSHILHTGREPLNLMRSKLRNTRFESLEKVFPQESVTELLNDIDRSKFSDIYFSNDMRKIYGLLKSNNDNDIFYDDFTITYSNPTISQTVLEASKKQNLKLFILPETPSIINQFSQLGSLANGFFSSTFYIYLLYSIIMAIRFRGMQNRKFITSLFRRKPEGFEAR
jgi:hypothetical protein